MQAIERRGLGGVLRKVTYEEPSIRLTGRCHFFWGDTEEVELDFRRGSAAPTTVELPFVSHPVAQRMAPLFFVPFLEGEEFFLCCARLAGWLAGWLVGWWVGGWVGGLVRSFVRWLVGWLIGSMNSCRVLVCFLPETGGSCALQPALTTLHKSPALKLA